MSPEFPSAAEAGGWGCPERSGELMGHSRAGLGALHVAGVPRLPGIHNPFWCQLLQSNLTHAPLGTSNMFPFLHTHQALPVSMTFANAGLSAWLTLFTRKRSNCSLKAQLKCPLFCETIFTPPPSIPPMEVPSGSCSACPSFSHPAALFCLSGPPDGQGLHGLPFPTPGPGRGRG